MIVTVTPAPAIDWTIALSEVTVGAVNRGHTAAREPSGKGVNVSVALTRNQVDSLAVVPLGGPDGQLFRQLASEQGINIREITIAAECRQNLTLREDAGRDTKINLPGAQMSPDEVNQLMESVTEVLQPGDTLVVAGSLPQGVGVELFVQLVERGHERGARVIVDTSGPGLSASLAAGPDLVKPNHHELGDEVGLPMLTLADVERGCEVLRSRGVGAVLASLGAQGAYYSDGSTRLYGAVSGVTPVNSVGAGDALLAGFIAHDTDPVQSLSRALLWGASAVQSATTLFDVDHTLAPRVSVTSEVDHTLVLS